MQLSAAIISKDEYVDEDLLKRLSFADEIIVVSSQTINRKSSGKIKYFYNPLNNDFASQRNFALTKTQGDWVLFVDTDEVVSSQLAREIETAIQNNKYSGFYIRRIDTYHNLEILHGETSNTKIIRLAKRRSGKFVRSVHETWAISGDVGELSNPLFHNKDKVLSEFLDRVALYGDIDAKNLSNEGKPFSYFRLLAYPKAKFILNYIIRKGFMDGTIGLFQAYLMSIQSLSVRVFQWTSRKSSTG